ncbi:LOW QUALITY PROTEIN: collectin-10 [Rhinophrynus dorsalis]
MSPNLPTSPTSDSELIHPTQLPLQEEHQDITKVSLGASALLFRPSSLPALAPTLCPQAAFTTQSVVTIVNWRREENLCTSLVQPVLAGDKGEIGDFGDQGLLGKIGPIGSKGDKGYTGSPGLPGGKGKRGSFCDCGRYRKVVGQLDVNVARLKSSLKFVKNVIAGIRETDEKYYYIVKEERNYRDALTQCRIRGGTLAMPKDQATNSLIADYISKMGLFRVFIGINDIEKEKQFMYTDNTPLQNYSSWKLGEPNDGSGYEDCVEMLSTGVWNDVDCQLTIYFVCEFVKKIK